MLPTHLMRCASSFATPRNLPRASWINQAEHWFAEFTRKQIQRGVHTSIRQIEVDIRIFIDPHNKNTKPFKWTNPLTRFWLKSNASVTELGTLYLANFKFA